MEGALHFRVEHPGPRRRSGAGGEPRHVSLDRDAQLRRRAEEVYGRLLEGMLGNAGLPALVDALAEATGLRAAVFDDYLALQACAPDDEHFQRELVATASAAVLRESGAAVAPFGRPLPLRFDHAATSWRGHLYPLQIGAAWAGFLVPAQKEMIKTWVPTWCPEQQYFDYCDPPCLFHDGWHEHMPQFYEPETCDFGGNLGEVQLTHHAHDEQYSLPLMIGKGMWFRSANSIWSSRLCALSPATLAPSASRSAL